MMLAIFFLSLQSRKGSSIDKCSGPSVSEREPSERHIGPNVISDVPLFGDFILHWF